MSGTPQPVDVYDPFETVGDATSLPFISIVSPTLSRIQAALDTCYAAGGGTVEVGPGSVNLTSQLQIGSYTTLIMNPNTQLNWTSSLVGLAMIRNRNRVQVAATGTITLTNGFDTVVGVGSLFTTQCVEGGLIRIFNSGTSTEYWGVVLSITDNTHLTLEHAWGYPTAAGVAFNVANGDRGIRIIGGVLNGGAGALVNYQDDEQGVWFTYCSDCHVEGMRLDHIRNDGIVFEMSRDCSMRNNTCTRALKAAYYLAWSDNCTISENFAWFNRIAAVEVGMSWFNQIVGNTFHSNGSSINTGVGGTTTVGINLSRASSFNVVAANHTDGVLLDASIVINYANGSLRFHHPGNAVYTQNAVYGCYSNAIVGNTIWAPNNHGVRVTLGARNRIARNEIINSGSDGVLLLSSPNNTVEFNQIGNCGLFNGGVAGSVYVQVYGDAGGYSTGAIVRGNRCYDDQGAPTSGNMLVNAGCTKTELLDNFIEYGGITLLESDVILIGNTDENGVPLDGDYTTPAFDAAIFTAAAGNWTVDSGDVVEFKYLRERKSMKIKGLLATTTVTATPLSLRFTIPLGYTAKTRQAGVAGWYDDGAGVVVALTYQVFAGDAKVYLYKSHGATNWSTTANATAVAFDIEVELNL
jgi:hypothetical protein